MIVKSNFNYLKKAVFAGFLFCAVSGASYVHAQDPGLPPSLPSSGLPPNAIAPSPSLDDVMGQAPGMEFDFEKNDQEIEESIRQEAFDNALNSLLPLRPEEIRTLIERYDRTQESVQVPIYPEPKPEIVVQTIALEPGSEPLRIQTSFGHVTTVNFVDVTGARWPIHQIIWAGDFNIVETPQDEIEVEGRAPAATNTLNITPEKEFARGNIVVEMLGLKTPIVMMLDTNREIVHYRFDAVVPDYGPFAETPLIDQGITLAAGRFDISAMLQGVIPSGAQRLTVNGVDGRTSAYAYNGRFYLRTPHNLLSPGWSSSVSSADGMKIYEIPNTPVVLLSDRGNMVRVRLSDRGELFDE